MVYGMYAGFGFRRTMPEQRGELRATLERVGTASRFRLTLKNTTDRPVVALLWPALYELRLHDRTGREVSDLRAFLESANLRGPSNDDWVIIEPGGAVTLEKVPFNGQGAMEVPEPAAYAEVTVRSTELMLLPPRSERTRSGTELVYLQYPARLWLK
jgi:hypothetical protein